LWKIEFYPLSYIGIITNIKKLEDVLIEEM